MFDALKFCLYDEGFANQRRKKRNDILYGSIPVFVGSILNRATDAFIVACVGDALLLEIVLRLLYALFAAHALTYFVVLKISTEDKFFEYYFSVASEVASFAWNAIIVLIIINWLYSTESLALSLGVWFVMVAFVASVISCSNYFREVYFPLTEGQKNYILEFESGAFALSLAYSLTVIVAVTIYRNASTNYVAGTDDLNSSVTDDSPSSSQSENWWFFSYSVIITLILLFAPFVHKYLQKHIFVAETIEETDAAAQKKPETATIVQRLRLQGIFDYFLGWDKERQTCKRGLTSLIELGYAYLIASAWNVWSVLSFQNYFQFGGGAVLGQFIFTATLIAAVMFISANLYLAEAKDPKSEESEQLKEFGGFFYKSSSLSFGWALQTLITTIVWSIVPGSSTSARPWVVFSVLVVLSTGAFYAGKWLHIRYVHSLSSSEERDSDKGLSLPGNINNPLLT